MTPPNCAGGPKRWTGEKRPWRRKTSRACRPRKPGGRSTNCGCIRSSWRCRTRSCAGRRRNWTPRGRAISTSTIWRRWAIARSAKQGLILEANLTAAGLLGVARGALVKQRLTSFILREDQDIYYRHRKQLFETGEPQACDLRMLEMDGTAFWARLEATAAEDAGGEPVCRVVMSDITERKRAEEALRGKRAALPLAI